MPCASPTAWLLGLACASALAAGQDGEPSAAEARLSAARDALAAAQDGLQLVFESLADDHLALTTGADAPTLRSALVLALHDALPAAEARVLASQTDGRPASRGTRGRILREVLLAAAPGSPGLDDRLATWIARSLAETLAGRTSLADLSRDDLLVLVAGLFPAGETFPGFWNRTFHDGLPETAALARAHAEYEAAGLALDRLRWPERYGPRGERAPPGMVVVAGGNYVLGPGAGLKRPLTKVQLQPFALDRREVTRREYQVFVEAQPPERRTALLPRSWRLDDAGLCAEDPALADLPVQHVSWEQAAGFAAWAGKRLPTEDEWEAAAAGPDGHVWPWGDEFRPGQCNGAGWATGVLPVESFPAVRSACGAYDLAGNVWEWTATLEDGRDVTALPDGPVNVMIRGGGHSSGRDELTSRYRWMAPARATFGNPAYDRPIGFRCAQDL